MIINYFHIEWFSETDGPGDRTVLFLQGCNLRCPWCHSPHSREIEAPIMFNKIRCLNCGRCINACNNGVHVVSEGIRHLERSRCMKCGRCIEACPASRAGSNSGALFLPTQSKEVSELFSLLKPQLDVMKDSGGLTLSGGEALLQKEALLELLKHCKSSGIHTAVETSLSLPLESYRFVSEYVDCWLIGMRDAYYENKTMGMDGGIVDKIRFLSTMGKEVIVRFPVIRGYTQSETQLKKLAQLMSVGSFKNIEILPCNRNMNHYYTLSGITPEINVEEALPEEVELDSILSFFKAQGFHARLII